MFKVLLQFLFCFVPKEFKAKCKKSKHRNPVVFFFLLTPNNQLWEPVCLGLTSQLRYFTHHYWEHALQVIMMSSVIGI